MNSYSTLTDYELMEKVSAYDSKALEVLYDRYSAILFTLVSKILQDEELSKKILSEIFVIIWKKSSSFDLKHGNIYTWFVTLSRNKAIDTLKRNKGLVLEEYTDDYEDQNIIPKLPPEIEEIEYKYADEKRMDIYTAFNSLTDAQKYVINLAYYEGLTKREIAQRLNIPFATVKSKIVIAMSNLFDFVKSRVRL